MLRSGPLNDVTEQVRVRAHLPRPGGGAAGRPGAAGARSAQQLGGARDGLDHRGAAGLQRRAGGLRAAAAACDLQPVRSVRGSGRARVLPCAALRTTWPAPRPAQRLSTPVPHRLLMGGGGQPPPSPGAPGHRCLTTGSAACACVRAFGAAGVGWWRAQPSSRSRRARSRTRGGSPPCACARWHCSASSSSARDGRWCGPCTCASAWSTARARGTWWTGSSSCWRSTSSRSGASSE
jgi:hypothetical protein